MSRFQNCDGPIASLLVAVLLAASGCTVSSPWAHFRTKHAAPPLVSSEVSTATTDKPAPEAALVQPTSYETPPSDELPAPIALPAADCSPNEHRLDMSTALALVAGQNPQVGYARARIRESYAALCAARVLWLPTIQAGVSYDRHEGNLQDSAGTILDVNRSSLQSGLGAGAVGAGTTPQPGIVAQFRLIDAIFEPRIAERAACAQEHARDAVLNDQLLAAAVAYQEVLRAYQRRAIAVATVERTDELSRLTTRFSDVGQGNQADADRSLAELALRRNDVARSEEGVAVASARLAQTISVDVGEQINPMEEVVTPIEIVPLENCPQDLLATALANRPELQESQALVASAVERLRREKYAPLVPSVLLGASYTGFGGGIGDTVAEFNDRADFDAVALWQVRNLGWGEQAARCAAAARIDQARFRQFQVMDQVARDVAEAYAMVVARHKRIAVAEAGIAAATSSFDRNLQRIRGGEGLPIEVLQAIQALDATQRELVDATVDYNLAQFQLQRALGWPIQ